MYILSGRNWILYLINKITMYILSGRNWILYLINKITLYILSGRNKNTLFFLRIYFEYIINYFEKIYKF